MNETPQQYTQRIMAHSEGKRPMAVQAATAKKLERAIKGVPTSKLRKRPAPNKWSVSEIAAHLADAEVAIGFRLRLILGAPGTPVAAFDQDAWGPACITRSAIRGSRSSSSACSAKPTWLCSKR